MKVKMSNSDYISLSCELADACVIEKYGDNCRKDGSYKNDEIQDCFDEWYSYYQSILAKYIEEII